MRRRTTLQQLIGRVVLAAVVRARGLRRRRGADRACAAPDVPGSLGSARRRSARSCARPGRATSCRNPTCGASSSAPGRLDRVLELGQQLLAIDDRDHAVVAGAVGDVDAILLGAGRNGAVNALAFLRGTRARLRADHPEIADVDRLGRIAQVVDLQVVAAVPSLVALVRDQIRDAGVALPPALVRPAEAIDDRDQLARLRRIGHVVEFVRRVAEGRSRYHFPLTPCGNVSPLHTRTICAPPRPEGMCARYFGRAGIGHVDDRRPVDFRLAGHRVHDRLLVVVMADVRDLLARSG